MSAVVVLCQAMRSGCRLQAQGEGGGEREKKKEKKKKTRQRGRAGGDDGQDLILFWRSCFYLDARAFSSSPNAGNEEGRGKKEGKKKKGGEKMSRSSLAPRVRRDIPKGENLHLFVVGIGY